MAEAKTALKNQKEEIQKKADNEEIYLIFNRFKEYVPMYSINTLKAGMGGYTKREEFERVEEGMEEMEGKMKEFVRGSEMNRAYSSLRNEIYE